MYSVLNALSEYTGFYLSKNKNYVENYILKNRQKIN